METGKKRAVLVDHRRAGKDKTSFNFCVREAIRRVGIYYYFFPTYNQGRKILWDGIDKEGFRFLDHAPKEIRKGDPNQTEMKLTLINGSLIQVVGSDNIDTVVGTNPVGCVFSEYALQDPRGWDFVRPILRENGGWAVFPYTPRGKNHGWKLYEMARENPEWYCERLTINDTWGKGGTVGPEDVEAERKAGMSDNLIQQEYFCSFDAAVEHAVFGEQIYKARQEGRVTRVSWDSLLPVNTYWDFGYGDATAIWFTQKVRNEIRLIDYYEAHHASLEHYASVLQQRPYKYDYHYSPHDGVAKDLRTGKSIVEIGWDLGLKFEVVPRLGKEHQINVARMIFNRCWFDETKCSKGIDALSSHHFDWDDKTQSAGKLPIHDWSSHGSDAFMLMAVAHEDQVEWKPKDKYAPKKKVNRSWMTA